MNVRFTFFCLMLISTVIITINASAQSRSAPQHFDNHGVKTFNRISIQYISPVEVEGTLLTVQNGSTDTLSVSFSGGIHQGRIFPRFESMPQALGPDTEWTTRPWELKSGASMKATLHVPARSKIVNSKNQYRNTDFVFEAFPLK